MPYHITLPAAPAMVAVARTAAATLLDDHPRRDDAVLVISEYFTNSVLHSASKDDGGTVRVTLDIGSEVLRIEVEDDGASTRHVERGGDYGRGLEVVDGLAAKWGHDRYDGRGVAWAELSWN